VEREVICFRIIL